MDLARSRRATVGAFPLDLAADEPNVVGALAHAAKVDIERALSVEGAECADAVAQPAEEGAKFGPVGARPPDLELQRRNESQA